MTSGKAWAISSSSIASTSCDCDSSKSLGSEEFEGSVDECLKDEVDGLHRNTREWVGGRRNTEEALALASLCICSARVQSRNFEGVPRYLSLFGLCRFRTACSV